MNTFKIIKAYIGAGTYSTTEPITQGDYGYILQIEGAELPATYRVDFANDRHEGDALTVYGNENGVKVPKELIDTGKNVYAFYYYIEGNFGKTAYTWKIPNDTRARYGGRTPTPTQQDSIDQLIVRSNEAVTSAEQNASAAGQSAQNASQDAGRAERARTGAETAQGKAEEAQESAERAKDDAEQSAEMISGYKQVTLSADVYGLSLDGNRETKKAETIVVDFSAWKGTERLNVTSITGIPTLYREGVSSVGVAIPYSLYRDAEYGFYRFAYALSSGWAIISAGTTATLTITAEDANGNTYTFTKEWSLCIVQDGASGTDGLSIGIASPSAVIYADADGYTTSAVTIKPAISAFKGSTALSYSANSDDSITAMMRNGTMRLIPATVFSEDCPPTWDIPKDAKLMPSAKALSITITADGQTVTLPYGYTVLSDGTDGQDGYSPTVSVTDITGGHEVAITDVQGTQTFNVMDGDDYVLTERDKQDIAGLVDVPVDDVQINGTSIVTNGVANVPIASADNVGLVKILFSNGIYIDNNNNLVLNKAADNQIKNGSASYRPIVAANQHSATFYGLAKAAGDTTQSASSNAVGNYTDEAKRAIREMLGLPRHTEAEVIADITTEENLESLVINTDQANNAFRLRFVKIYINYGASTTGAASYITTRVTGHVINGNDKDFTMPTLQVSETGLKALHFFKTTGGIVEQYSTFDTVSIEKTLSTIRTFNFLDLVEYISAIKLLKYNADNTLIPAGTRIIIQGIRA